jgi:Uma2 family endonuclease
MASDTGRGGAAQAASGGGGAGVLCSASRKETAISDVAFKPMTTEEFLVWQESQEERYEFIDGRSRAMTGASHGHDIIAVNILRELSMALRGKPCRATTSDITVQLPGGNIRRPDAMVECSPRTDGTVAHEPVVIVEVLSPSTRVLDQTTKFIEYRALASVTDYLLVQQERPEVAHYWRQVDGVWAIEIVAGLDGQVRLDRIGVALPLADLYDRIDFEPAGERQAVPR